MSFANDKLTLYRKLTFRNDFGRPAGVEAPLASTHQAYTAIPTEKNANKAKTVRRVAPFLVLPGTHAELSVIHNSRGTAIVAPVLRARSADPPPARQVGQPTLKTQSLN